MFPLKIKFVSVVQIPLKLLGRSSYLNEQLPTSHEQVYFYTFGEPLIMLLHKLATWIGAL